MTTKLTEVQAALAAAASEGTGITFTTYAQDAFDAPGGWVKRLPFDPRLVFSGSRTSAVFQVIILVNAVEPDAAAAALDDYTDPLAVGSVFAAVQDGDNWPTELGVNYAQVVQIGEIGEARTEVGDRYFAVALDVEVCW